MIDLTDWITELKVEKPELNDFITKIEGFISETGFNIVKFEKAVDLGLKEKEEEVGKTFEADVEN